jgi:hypothetical protein
VISVSGVVMSLASFGFRVRTDAGDEQDIYTFTPGYRLALTPGDRVRVLGGHGASGAFLCSTIIRCGSDGNEVEIPDAPSPGR